MGGSLACVLLDRRSLNSGSQIAYCLSSGSVSPTLSDNSRQVMKEGIAMDFMDVELQTAVRAVVLASQICRRVQAKIDGGALSKNDKSPVTIADFASQAVICRELRHAFPNDPIVAEEDAEALRSSENANFVDEIVDEIAAIDMPVDVEQALTWIDYGNHDGTAKRFWTLDPIDGTKGFLRKEQYAISLALIVDGVIQVAALACPNLSSELHGRGATGVVFSAVRGQGAHVALLANPDLRTPVHVSAVEQAALSRMCESVESGHSSHSWSGQIRERLNSNTEPVQLDSQAKYGVVARGDADIYLRLPTRKDYQEKIWDHAGGVLVIEEAGGTVTDIHGKPLDFSLGSTLRGNQGVVATNGLLHDAVLAVVAESRPAI